MELILVDCISHSASFYDIALSEPNVMARLGRALCVPASVSAAFRNECIEEFRQCDERRFGAIPREFELTNH